LIGLYDADALFFRYVKP